MFTNGVIVIVVVTKIIIHQEAACVQQKALLIREIMQALQLIVLIHIPPKTVFASPCFYHRSSRPITISF